MSSEGDGGGVAAVEWGARHGTPTEASSSDAQGLGDVDVAGSEHGGPSGAAERQMHRTAPWALYLEMSLVALELVASSMLSMTSVPFALSVAFQVLDGVVAFVLPFVLFAAGIAQSRLGGR